MEAMEVPSTARKPSEGAKEGLDSSSTAPTNALEQRNRHPRSLLKTSQQPIFSQRDHRSLPPLQIPRQSNHFPLHLLHLEKKDRILPPTTTTQQTTYRYTGGDIYRSAQALVNQPEQPNQSRSTLSDPNFLQLVQSAASSNEDLSWSGDQSPISSGSAATTIRESLPAYFLENTQDGADSFQLRRLTLSWTTTSMLNALKERQWGKPVAPAECGMQSTFREKFSIDPNAPKLSQKALDDGFDVALFMLSTRVYDGNRKHLSGFVPYKLRASQSVVLEYSTANAVTVRRKLAWIKLCTALDPRSANERLSREFEEIAADFFGGHSVEAEYGDGFASFNAAPKPYSLKFKGGDRTRVLGEQPLASPSLAIFLEDVIMANEMEEARVQNETYQNGLRVYRHQSYTEVYSSLQNARKEQQKCTYHDLTKGFNSDMTPELRKLIIEVSSDLPEQKVSILEIADGGGRPSISRYKSAALEAGSSAKGISQEQDTIVTGTATVVESTSATVSTKNVGAEDTKSAPAQLSNIKKGKKGSKRKKAKKCNTVEKSEESSSAQLSQSLDCVELAPEEHLGVGAEFEHEAQTCTQNGSQDFTTSEYDGAWNEVKPEVPQKPRSSKKENLAAFMKTSHKTPAPVQLESGSFREFKPEEYHTLLSDASATKSAGHKTNGGFTTSASTIKLSADANSEEEDTVRNMPPVNSNDVQSPTHNQQASITPDRARLGSVAASIFETLGRQSQSAESTTSTKECHGESVSEAPNSRCTGLEWAAAELSSPTKFKSSWRHSSLPHRSTTPNQDGFDESVEISTTRRRSNTTAVLDPRVRAVQFGDFPVAVQEMTESASITNSGYSVSPSHSVEETASTYHIQVTEPNYTPLANNFLPPLGFSTTLFTAQMHTSQPHHATPMFMPTQYPPPAFFAPGSLHQAGFQASHSAAPYRVSIPPGFSYPSRPMILNSSDYTSTRARPAPAANDYSPNTYVGAGIPNQNQYTVDQTSESEGEHDGSFSGLSRSDESSEGSSGNNQEPGQPTNAQRPTAIAGYTCSSCNKGYFPCVQRPLYFCAGCGPTCAIRYCSAACLLADAYHHTHHCSQYPHYMRVDPHNMPSDIYEYERFYLAPCELRTPQETPERFRQRQFAMYCFHGRFPQILRAWAEKHQLPVGLAGCDINESFKKTGDYHIFRSEVSADGKKFAPCEVICTLRLRNRDPMKEALTRALNACLIFLQPRVIKFLFRLLRHLILDLDNWSLMMPVLDQRTVYAEFIHQFSLEFSFDAEAHTNDFSRFDLTEEWRLIKLDMEDLEMQFQVLRCWYRVKSDRISPPLEPRN